MHRISAEADGAVWASQVQVGATARRFASHEETFQPMATERAPQACCLPPLTIRRIVQRQTKRLGLLAQGTIKHPAQMPPRPMQPCIERPCRYPQPTSDLLTWKIDHVAQFKQLPRSSRQYPKCPVEHMDQVLMAQFLHRIKPLWG